MRVLRSVSGMVVALLVAAGTLAAAKYAPPGRDVAVSQVVAALQSARGECGSYGCKNCGLWTAHEVGDAVIHNQTEQFDCASVDCPVACNASDATEEASAAAWDAAADDDVASLQRLVASSPFVTYNAKRMALQVVGCTGEVTDHIPLTVAQVSALQH